MGEILLCTVGSESIPYSAASVCPLGHAQVYKSCTTYLFLSVRQEIPSSAYVALLTHCWSYTNCYTLRAVCMPEARLRKV